MMTSLLWWMFLLTSSTMTLAEGAGARREEHIRPPLPPYATKSEPNNPTWPTAVHTTVASDQEKRGGDPFSGWPWWWWIPASAGMVVIVGLNFALCVWCCCRQHRRRSSRNAADQNGEGDSVEIHAPPTDFRRMESSAAKRYLHNIASVFSWGSDFEGDQTPQTRRPSNVIYANSGGQRGTVVYANTQTLGIPVSEESARRKSGQHYRNLV
ncbi:hypothetical protein ACOMHN_040512 [Nucella lapillus]